MSVTIDTVAPDAPEITTFSPDNTVILGNAEANSVVNIYDADTNALLATTTANADGEYAAAYSNGFNDLNLRVTATDLAGNTSAIDVNQPPVQGPSGLITVVQNVLANFSDDTAIEPLSTLVNNLVDPNASTLAGLTSILELITTTNQPITGSITELVDNLTAANTGGDANLGALINALNSVAGFLGSSDPDALSAANQNLATFINGSNGLTAIPDILDSTIVGATNTVGELLGGSVGINIEMGALSEALNATALSGALGGLLGGVGTVLDDVLDVLNPILTVGGLAPQNAITVSKITNALTNTISTLLADHEVILNGVAHDNGLLNDVVATIISDNQPDLLDAVFDSLGLVGGVLGTLLGPITNQVLAPVITGLLNGLLDGTIDVLEPASPNGAGGDDTLFSALSGIVSNLAGTDTPLEPLSTLIDNLIRNDGFVASDILNAIDDLTNTNGGALGPLTELVNQLNTAGVDELTQGLSGLLDGLLEQVVEPLVGGIFDTDRPLPDMAGDDVMVSGTTDETFFGGEGSDTLIFKVLNAADDAGGNGSDTWRDFELGDTTLNQNADKIDISELLVGYSADGSATSLAGYVTVAQVGGDTVLTIDRDGEDATTYAPTELLTLTNVYVDSLETLLENNQLVF